MVKYLIFLSLAFMPFYSFARSVHTKEADRIVGSFLKEIQKKN